MPVTHSVPSGLRTRHVSRSHLEFDARSFPKPLEREHLVPRSAQDSDQGLRRLPLLLSCNTSADFGLALFGLVLFLHPIVRVVIGAADPQQYRIKDASRSLILGSSRFCW